VRCARCGLVQYRRVQCVRCRSVLPTMARKEYSVAPAKAVEPPLAALMQSLCGMGTLPTVGEMERALMLAAMERSDRNAVRAAALIGMSKTNFYWKLRRQSEAVDRNGAGGLRV